QALALLGERDRRAGGVLAEEPPDSEPEQDRVPADRRVGQPPPVRTVHPFRELAALPAGGTFGAGARPDAQAVVRELGGFHDDYGKMRQQQLQADSALA